MTEVAISLAMKASNLLHKKEKLRRQLCNIVKCYEEWKDEFVVKNGEIKFQPFTIVTSHAATGDQRRLWGQLLPNVIRALLRPLIEALPDYQKRLEGRQARPSLGTLLRSRRKWRRVELAILAVIVSPPEEFGSASLDGLLLEAVLVQEEDHDTDLQNILWSPPSSSPTMREEEKWDFL
ncbi:hypothetical protein PIB30_031976 [Stylosanthes scabra]|uniref:Uncharacterized protein n=1 Tax=Stylosanthes scabra TaxID=79078 RepID=A0ABU6UBF2_9FABA|nr:hypothetical protein [Stylosanthes scabra]